MDDGEPAEPGLRGSNGEQVAWTLPKLTGPGRAGR
jgi:hypothetical protein